MTDHNTLLSDVSSKYGAPMGRDTIEDNPAATVTLFRVRMVDGDYDAGGAYWGGGPGVEPLYGAIGEDFQCFFRANNLALARLHLSQEYPDLTIEDSEVNDDFLTAYIEAALWSSNDESDESGGEPLDQNYQAADLAEETLQTMTEQCRAFLEQVGYLITNDNLIRGRVDCFAQAGHDFWLTRNRSGAGFWDGDWEEEAAKVLTHTCDEFGETYLYIGDDGKIYQE